MIHISETTYKGKLYDWHWSTKRYPVTPSQHKALQALYFVFGGPVEELYFEQDPQFGTVTVNTNFTPRALLVWRDGRLTIAEGT